LGGPETAMLIDFNGNVGIGTTSPSKKLTIFDQINGSPTEDQSYGEIGFGSRSDGTIGASVKALAGDNNNGTDGKIQFLTASNTVGGGPLAPRMTIDSNGNVGIGTTDPVYKFHVADATEANLLIQRTTPDGDVPGLTLNSVGGTGINNRTGDISLTILDTTGNSEPVLRFSTTNGANPTKHTMFITNGNVGIGTTDPSAKLDVAGNVNVVGEFKASSSVYTFSSTGFGVGVLATYDPTIHTEGNVYMVTVTRNESSSSTPTVEIGYVTYNGQGAPFYLPSLNGANLSIGFDGTKIQASNTSATQASIKFTVLRLS
jgi:hypothetical protein